MRNKYKAMFYAWASVLCGVAAIAAVIGVIYFALDANPIAAVVCGWAVPVSFCGIRYNYQTANLYDRNQ